MQPQTTISRARIRKGMPDYRQKQKERHQFFRREFIVDSYAEWVTLLNGQLIEKPRNQKQSCAEIRFSERPVLCHSVISFHVP